MGFSGKKKVKDKKNVPKKDPEGNTNSGIGRSQGDAREPVARQLLAARSTDLDKYEAPREHTHSSKLLFQAQSLDLIKYELSRIY